MRIATGKSSAGPDATGKFSEDAGVGEWEGVQCCPSCLEPITENEKWAACCSKCGYTDYAYIKTLTRARRRITDSEGKQFWEWKDHNITPVDWFKVFIFAICISAGGVVIAALVP